MAVRGTRGCDVRQIEVELHVLALCPSAATVAALVESWIGTDAAVLDLAGRVTTSVDRAVGAVRTLLDGAFGCMADEGTREAARIMWSIVDGAEGDRPYKQRQVEAAKRLFMSYENFRPRGTRGHYLVVRAELARALIAAAHPPGPDLPPSSPGAATTTSLPSFGRSAPAARRRGRRGLIVAVAAAIILSVAGSMLGSGDDRAAIPGDGTCRHMIGEPAKDLAREHVERLAMVEAQLVELSAPGACPAGAVSLHHDVLIQELLTPDGRRDGAITVSAHGVVVRLPEPVYAGFLEIRLGNPAEAARRAGAPLAVTAGEPMVVVLELGGVLISPTAAGPFFWVPQEGMAMWEMLGGADGAIGYPTTNPYSLDEGLTLRQDYEHGRLEAPRDAPTSVTWTPVGESTLRAMLPPDVSGRILRQLPGPTAWHVDPETGARRWIPDADTWHCLGGSDNALVDVPAPAIWLLPAGPPAVCPDTT